MRNSLLFKLLGAFAIVIAIGALVVSVLTSNATRSAFSLYTTRSGQIWAERISQYLADYYSQSNSWQGVDAVLKSDLSGEIMPGGNENRAGQGQGRGTSGGWQNFSGSMFLIEQRLILADATGTVLSDSSDLLVGQKLLPEDLESGTAVTVHSEQIGTLIVTPDNLTNRNTPAGEFLASVNRAIITSAVISGLIALIVGALLFVQIIRPLHKLRGAAAAIASGDLQQRVNIQSQDELGELGTTFNRMAENLTNAENQRRNLVADVAHELRTPLAAIQGTLEGMQDGILPRDDSQVAALYAETTLLNRLVGDLRLLSLVEAGQLELHQQLVDPTTLILQIAERMKPQANQKSIDLEVSLPPNLPTLTVDSDRITQVLSNLIGNAIRYTPPNGVISVHADAPAGSGLLEISVSDTGHGIDPADLPYIFNRFYRTDKSRARSSGGSGLGLAIARQLVETHSGRINAESPIYQDKNGVGYGTRVIFTLPIRL
jgi:two-component system OmpR family sensor kinase/two-component system sensor histidine kinase BaeS